MTLTLRKVASIVRCVEERMSRKAKKGRESEIPNRINIVFPWRFHEADVIRIRLSSPYTLHFILEWCVATRLKPTWSPVLSHTGISFLYFAPCQTISSSLPLFCRQNLRCNEWSVFSQSVFLIFVEFVTDLTWEMDGWDKPIHPSIQRVCVCVFHAKRLMDLLTSFLEKNHWDLNRAYYVHKTEIITIFFFIKIYVSLFTMK